VRVIRSAEEVDQLFGKGSELGAWAKALGDLGQSAQEATQAAEKWVKALQEYGEKIARDSKRRQRELEDVLREDARADPAFATARRAAILAFVETIPGTSPLRDAGTIRHGLRVCRWYEESRGGARKPSAKALELAAMYPTALAAYERARGVA
jgi:hypothetical protein